MQNRSSAFVPAPSAVKIIFASLLTVGVSVAAFNLWQGQPRVAPSRHASVGLPSLYVSTAH